MRRLSLAQFPLCDAMPRAILDRRTDENRNVVCVVDVVVGVDDVVVGVDETFVRRVVIAANDVSLNRKRRSRRSLNVDSRAIKTKAAADTDANDVLILTRSRFHMKMASTELMMVRAYILIIWLLTGPVSLFDAFLTIFMRFLTIFMRCWF